MFIETLAVLFLFGQVNGEQVLNQHGFAVWAAVILLTFAVGYLGWLIRQQSNREDGVLKALNEERAFIRQTLMTLCADMKILTERSTSVTEEATRVLREMRSGK